ncbi:MAG TPA: DUF58 domain-containing protein [Syntrophorhabdaceae bacterium]|nr:DUF58 domain-containing protein [Syntrophorhabdaceae bacterium]
MSISGIFGKSNLSKLEFVIEFPQEIYAGSQFPVKITIQNQRRFLPAFLIGLSAEKISALLPFTPNRGESSLYTNVTFLRRGLYTIEKPYVYSVFPFNFFTRFKKIDRVYTIMVLPSLKACDLASLYRKERRTRGEKTSDKIGYDSDIISIREYVRGDPLKYIHWKATAKTGKLKTKEHSSLSYQPVTIDFDRVLVKDLEERISCVAFTIVQLIKTNVPVGLKIDGRLYPPDVTAAHKLNMLRELALYGTNSS